MAMLNPYNYKKPNTMVKSVKPKVTVKPNLTSNPYKKTDNYLEQKVLSAKPEELTLMLYDGAIKFLKQVKMYNDQKNIPKSNYTNQRVQAIISELRATLNMDYDISKNLEQLYVYMNERLVEANIRKDNNIIDEVLDLIVDLRDTWKEAMKIAGV